MSRQIIVSNESSLVSDADAQARVNAVQKQIDRDFAPAYSGLRADLVFWPRAKGPPPDGQESVRILDDSDQAGALGYHRYAKGYPEGFVFVRSSQQAGEDWSTVLSHEVLEQLFDPFARITVQAQVGNTIVWVMAENCDPCEGDSYVIDGIAVSNFVLPAWFAGGTGKVDFLGKLSRGLTVDHGGYIAYCDSTGSWQQIQGMFTHARHADLMSAYSRKERYVMGGEGFRGGFLVTVPQVMECLQLAVAILQVAPTVVREVWDVVQTIRGAISKGAELTAPTP